MREEVVLALDLYWKYGGIAPRSECRTMSALLRALPVDAELARNDPSFRGPRSVENKLYNLQYLATAGERGRANGGQVDRDVWAEFGEEREAVAAAANEVRAALADLTLLPDSDPSPSDDYEANEGSVVIKTHRTRERDRKIGQKKRDAVLAATGTLACEACAFDSAARYGVPGIVECHHLKAVSALKPGEKTKPSDLRLLCPNCHRLVHSRRPWMTWSQLIQLVG